MEYKIKKKQKNTEIFVSETLPDNILNLGLYNTNPKHYRKIESDEQKEYKIPRLLYIGNLPSQFQEIELKTILYNNLQKASGVLGQDNPVYL